MCKVDWNSLSTFFITESQWWADTVKQPKYLFYQINVKKLQKGQSKEKGIKKVFIISNVEPWNCFFNLPIFKNWQFKTLSELVQPRGNILIFNLINLFQMWMWWLFGVSKRRQSATLSKSNKCLPSSRISVPNCTLKQGSVLSRILSEIKLRKT